MLPKKHHEHDNKWLAEQIAKLPPWARDKAITGYSDAFNHAHEKEPTEHKKMNAARYAANTRLRVYVERICA